MFGKTAAVPGGGPEGAVEARQSAAAGCYRSVARTCLDNAASGAVRLTLGQPMLLFSRRELNQLLLDRAEAELRLHGITQELFAGTTAYHELRTQIRKSMHLTLTEIGVNVFSRLIVRVAGTIIWTKQPHRQSKIEV